MMLPGEILKSVKEFVYFIDLLPCDFMKMTLNEIYEVYEHRMKRIEYDNKADDMRTARICSLIANIYRDSKKRRKPFTEDDFMPKKEEKKKEKKEQSIDQMASILMLITKANGGQVPK